MLSSLFQHIGLSTRCSVHRARQLHHHTPKMMLTTRSKVTRWIFKTVVFFIAVLVTAMILVNAKFIKPKTTIAIVNKPRSVLTTGQESVSKTSPITTTRPATKMSSIITTSPVKQNKTSNSTHTLPRQFHKAMSDEDAAILDHILRRFTEVADKANVTYFMYWGTLIGSYRHHDRMPWDDEVDLMIPASQKQRVIEVFAPLLPTYVINRSAKYRWKFHMANSTAIKRKGFNWKFPFLDLSFYRENQTTLWDEDPVFTSENTYPKKFVFPLCRRPFSKLMLPAPRDPSTIFKLGLFDIVQCASTRYNHSLETFNKNTLTLPCSKLYDDVPFVFRTNTTHGMNETLKIGHTIIDSKTISGCAS